MGKAEDAMVRVNFDDSEEYPVLCVTPHGDEYFRPGESVCVPKRLLDDLWDARRLESEAERNLIDWLKANFKDADQRWRFIRGV
jgi:hypothetical protein